MNFQLRLFSGFILLLAGCNSQPQGKEPAPTVSTLPSIPEPTPTPTQKPIPTPKIVGFVPLHASTAKPAPSSLSALSNHRATAVLTVPFYNDRLGIPVFSPDGQWLAAAGFGWAGNGPPGKTHLASMVFVWNVRTRVLMKKLEVPPPNSGVRNLAWSPDGKRIAAWSDSSSGTSSVIIWDVASQVGKAYSQGVLTATSACFLSDGRLLISWFNNVNPTANESRVSVIQGKQQKLIDTGENSVVGFIHRRSQPPLALSFISRGLTTYGEPKIQASVREWRNNRLSAPIIQFRPGDALLAMALSRDEKILALAGIDQMRSMESEAKGLFVGCDPSKKEILWRAYPNNYQFSLDLSFSRNGLQIWGRTSYKGQTVIDARTGQISSLASNDVPVFSSDGRFAALRVDGERGQKPYLTTFRLFERR